MILLEPSTTEVLTLVDSLGGRMRDVRYIPPRGGHKPEWARVGERLTEAVLDHANPCRGAP